MIVSDNNYSYVVNSSPKKLDPTAFYSAIPGMDYKFANINTSVRSFNFTISPDTTRSFEVTIIDDNIAERRRKILFCQLYANYGFIGIHSNIIGFRQVLIEDNDGKFFQSRID